MSAFYFMRSYISHCIFSLKDSKTISALHKRLEAESSEKLGIGEATLGQWVSAGRKIGLLVNAGKCYVLMVDARLYALGRITIYPPFACP